MFLVCSVLTRTVLEQKKKKARGTTRKKGGRSKYLNKCKLGRSAVHLRLIEGRIYWVSWSSSFDLFLEKCLFPQGV